MKGINFLGTLDALEREHGAAARSATLEAVCGDVGEALRANHIIAGSWYPVSWYAELLRALTEVTGERDASRRLARAAVHHDFRTLFRLVRLLLSPERVLGTALRVFARYYSGGDIEVLISAPGQLHYRVSGVSGFDARVWRDLAGGSEGVIESMGRDEVRSQFNDGGGDGDRSATIALHWSA